MVDQRSGGRLAVGAGDPDHLVRRKLGAGAGEQLDVADDLDACLAGALGDGMAVEREAGGNDEGVELGEVGGVEVGFLYPGGRFRPRFLFPAPPSAPRAAGKQRFDCRQPRPRKPVDRVMLGGEGAGGDHLSLSVARPASASTKLMIQKRITTVGSDQPICSKWWWIGAIRKTRFPVRL